MSDGKSRLETDIRILLHEVSAVGERAGPTRERRKTRIPAVEGALGRLAAAEQEIRRLRPADADVHCRRCEREPAQCDVTTAEVLPA